MTSGKTVAAVDLNQVVMAAASAEARRADEKGIILAVGTVEGVLTARVDAASVEQAVAGLIEAGIRASTPGDVVTVTAEDIVTAAQIGVADTAATPSETAETTQAVRFAAEVVKRHGGSLRHDAQPGGTIFTLIVPTKGNA